MQLGLAGFCVSSPVESRTWRADDEVGRMEIVTTRVERGTESFDVLFEEDVFICDSGASNHSSKSKVGARNERPTNSSSLGHAGEAVEAECTIDLAGQFVAKDGSLGLKATLTEVSVNKKYNFNLISLTRLLRNGWHITQGDDTGIVIENKDGNRIAFDIVVLTARGAIFACRFVRDVELSAVGTEAGISITKAHRLLGHVHEERTRQIAKHLGWRLTRGTLKNKPCEPCALAKAKQKAVCKSSEAPKQKKPGELVYLDLSKVTVSRLDGTEFELSNKYWRSVVDGSTGKKWCGFTPTKKGMVEEMCEFMNIMKSLGIPISAIRMDPGGENEALEKRLKSKDWGPTLQPVDVQLTSRETPQHNHAAELSFPYIAGLSRAMMNDASIPDNARGAVACEAIKCAVQLDGLAVVELNGESKTRDEHVFGSNPKWAANLRTWGEAGVVKVGKDGKTGDRGIKMMFVGYSNRESDSCRMFNPETNRVWSTRDVIWLNKMFYEKPVDNEINVGLEIELDPSAEDEVEQGDDYEEDEQIPDLAEEIEEEVPVVEDEVVVEDEAPVNATNRTRTGRLIRAPERLIETMASMAGTGTAAEMRMLGALAELDNLEIATAAFLNNSDLDLEALAEQLNLSSLGELNLVGAGLDGGVDMEKLKVMNFREAMASDDADKWMEEVLNEKRRMDKFNAFTPVPRSELPANAKVLSTTWAMKLKANGTRRGRLNARGYEQQDGVHYFSDSIYAPVTNPAAIRIGCTLLAMNPDYIAIVLDVEGAFLQGAFLNGEKIYAEVPDGWESFYGGDDVLLMNVPIYGTKQASQCFYKAFVKGMVESKKYRRSKAQPCMFFEWIDGRLVLFLVWTDDVIVFGTPAHVAKVEADIKSVFESKSEGALTEYVGSKIDVKRREDGIGTVTFTQPILVRKLKDKYGDKFKGSAPRTPAKEGQVLVRGDGSGQLEPDEASDYRSGTATVLYMAQWSRPECQNTVRGLATQMSAPRVVHQSAMYTAINYIVTTSNRGWTLTPDTKWDGSIGFVFRISGRADSDHAANTDDRRSVSGGRTFLNECPIIVRSATQKSVSLSVTESEQNAGVMVAQDMLYLLRTMQALDLKVELPMALEIDNKGAVYLANNMSVGGRTRHVDVKSHFLRELKDKGLIVVRHISGDDNDADIFTKNTSVKVFERHLPKFVGFDEYMSSSSGNT